MFYYGEVDGDCDKEGFGIFLINGGDEWEDFFWIMLYVIFCVDMVRWFVVGYLL